MRRACLVILLCLLPLACSSPLRRPALPPGAPPDGGQAAALPELRGGSERGQRPPAAEHIAAHRSFAGQLFAHGDPRPASPGTRPAIALTFDDGPDATYTPRILDELKAAGVHATFFFTGQRVQAYPAVARRTAAEGHAIGNHSYDHPDMTRLDAAAITAQLRRTDELIRRHAGVAPALFRPPYGKYTPTVIRAAAGLGYKVVLWSVDSLDWESLTPDRILANVAPHLTPGAIVLMHSASGGPQEVLSGTLQAVPRIIDLARRRGLSLVTVSELLGSRRR